MATFSVQCYVPCSSNSSFNCMFPIQKHGISTSYYTPCSLQVKKLSTSRSRIVSATEGEGVVSVAEQSVPATTIDQTVSVPVSPSDILTMFFHAEGTMNEAAIPMVLDALEEAEGISDLKVRVLEGIASVELTKQTTIQATGVASSLIETIQGSGFKLQSLNLSFQDEEGNN